MAGAVLASGLYARRQTNQNAEPSEQRLSDTGRAGGSSPRQRLDQSRVCGRVQPRSQAGAPRPRDPPPPVTGQGRHAGRRSRVRPRPGAPWPPGLARALRRWHRGRTRGEPRAQRQPRLQELSAGTRHVPSCVGEAARLPAGQGLAYSQELAGQGSGRAFGQRRRVLRNGVAQGSVGAHGASSLPSLPSCPGSR